MAQALGYVTKTEVGNFQGTLNLGGTSRINIVANDNKESDKQHQIFGPASETYAGFAWDHLRVGLLETTLCEDGWHTHKCD